MKSQFTLLTTAATVALGLALAPAAALAQASTDTTAPTEGQARSGEPTTGAGSTQLPSPHSLDQGGTGVKGSAQGEGATNKDPAARDAGRAYAPPMDSGTAVR